MHPLRHEKHSDIMMCSCNILAQIPLDGFESSCSHISLTDSFYFLKTVLEGEFIEFTKEVIEQGNNLDIFMIHYFIEFTHITEENRGFSLISREIRLAFL